MSCQVVRTNEWDKINGWLGDTMIYENDVFWCRFVRLARGLMTTCGLRQRVSISPQKMHKFDYMAWQMIIG